MKKSKTKMVIMIITFILFIATLGIILTMGNLYNQTEDTTTLFTATVSDVEIVDTVEDIYAKIYIEEYDTYLHISDAICNTAKINDIKDLKSGETIHFRIENINANDMGKVIFASIDSLKTDTKDIFTLDEYNEIFKEALFPTKIAAIVTAVIFISISLYCFVTLKKKTTR